MFTLNNPVDRAAFGSNDEYYAAIDVAASDLKNMLEPCCSYAVFQLEVGSQGMQNA